MSLGMLGKYEKLGILGRGVSGIVYLAKDTLLNRQIALKEVDVQAGDLRRFLEEARVMDRLRHPNIVRVNGIDRIDDKVVIDMEYVRGRNLQETLRAEGPLSVAQSVSIGMQILDGLEYAHSRQTVHRDIKPANILLDRDGTVKLADFGLAEILATNAYACGAGTYAYMAPEDFEEENHSDCQSDIWAVAVTMFEMMTGERPFEVSNPKSPFAWKRALESQSPRSLRSLLPDAPQALDVVIAHGMARSKEMRYQTAAAFRNDLARIGLTDSSHQKPQRVSPEKSAGPIWHLSQPEIGDRAETEVNPWTRREPAANMVAARSFMSGDTVAPTTAAKQPEVETRGARRLFRRGARRREAKLVVSPSSIDFGSLRGGELRHTRLTARTINLAGAADARVVQAPGWVSVEPTEFASRRQSLSITVHPERTAAVGSTEDSILIESAAGSALIPIHINVLKDRPTFRQVAFWFVPLLCIVLAPAVITATLGAGKPMLPAPAAVCTLALGMMLYLISVAADIGIYERLTSGVIMASMCIVLGFTVAERRAGYNDQLEYGLELAVAGAIGLGLIVVAQLITSRRWRFWGVVLACLGVLLGGACYHMAVV